MRLYNLTLNLQTLSPKIKYFYDTVVKQPIKIIHLLINSTENI